MKGPPFWMAWYCVAVAFSMISRLLQVIVEFSQLEDKLHDLMPRRVLQFTENRAQNTVVQRQQKAPLP